MWYRKYSDERMLEGVRDEYDCNSVLPTQGTSAMYKRVFDILIVLITLPITCVVMFVVIVCLRISSPYSVFYYSKRIGENGKQFIMPKFRTMRPEAPDLPPYEFKDCALYYTPLGAVLRKTSLDELPQIWCVLRGTMSLVGPRPAGVNEADLIRYRNSAGVSKLLPGITGWAQINGRNKLSVIDKVKYDREYLDRQSCYLDVLIIFFTVPKILFFSDVVT